MVKALVKHEMIALLLGIRGPDLITLWDCGGASRSKTFLVWVSLDLIR